MTGRCTKDGCNQYALAHSVGGGLCRTHFFEARRDTTVDKLVSVLASVNEWAI